MLQSDRKRQDHKGPCKPCFIFVLKMPGEIRVQEGVEIIHRARVLRGRRWHLDPRLS